MSVTSASEPPILATQVEILDNIEEADVVVRNHKSKEALMKRLPRQALGTTTEASDRSSSVLWTPAQPGKKDKQASSHHRSHRKGHRSKRRGHKDEKTTGESGDTSTALLRKAESNETEKRLSFERDYHHQHHKNSRRNGSNFGRPSTRRSGKKHQELYNDYTRYQYHRRTSKRDKNRKRKSRSEQNSNDEVSPSSGLPKIIKRIKDFFFGKKTDEEHRSKKSSNADHSKELFYEYPASRKHKHKPSGNLFRSASDSDLEAVKHHHRRSLHKKQAKDDHFNPGKHWKSRHHEKLSSIYESSDRSGRLGSGSDAGRLVITRNGRIMHNDITALKNGDIRRTNGHYTKDERNTSDGSHSSHGHRRHRRRSKEYLSLKKKWVKQHQSFENDLEKLERLVELIGLKKSQRWLEQKTSDETTLLERLEATQEKCVAEVDFTRHVLICKLQRLENKLEQSLSSIDYNHNNTLTDERGRSIDEIRDEMSKEYRDLRKLLQETSTQLKQVLDEKPQEEADTKKGREHHGTSTSSRTARKHSTPDTKVKNDSLNTTTKVPFPELSHHPLNAPRSRNNSTSEGRLSENDHNEVIKDQNAQTAHEQQQQQTRVTTYV